MLLPITSLLASALGIWLVILSLRVAMFRKTERISIGHGENNELHRRQRAQGNLTEYAPIALILFALAEMQNFDVYILGALAILFLIARLVHGYIFSFKVFNLGLRQASMIATFACIVALALINIWLVVSVNI